MKTDTQYSTGQKPGILVIGEPGSGKTCLAFEFPNPYFLDLDHNLDTGRTHYQRRYGKAKQFRWDQPDTRDDGTRVPAGEVWDYARKQLDAALNDPWVETVVIDGLTRLSDALIAYVIKQGSALEKSPVVGGVPIMTRSLYGPYGQLLTGMLMALRASSKLIVVTAHVRAGENELTDAATWQPNLVGALRGSLAGLFTDFWMCDTEQILTPTDATRALYPANVKYFAHTAPRPQVKLKNSFGLPAKFEFTWEAFAPYWVKCQAGAIIAAA